MNAPLPGSLSVAEALERVLYGLEPLQNETVRLESAADRVLGEDLAAQLTQPPFDASAMDGYAARANDVAGVPATLTLVGESAAGHPYTGTLGAGEAVRIFTGGSVPAGADTIVIQENTEQHDKTVRVLETAKAGQYIRPAGFDFAKGDVLLKAGTKLNARDLALAATMNCPSLPVRRKPVVAILATGDELVPVGAEPGAGQIISSVPHGLAPLIARAGGEPIRLGIARDTAESLNEHLERAADADIVLTIGGASVGDHDLVQQALKDFGVSMGFWKIAMRPGKPLMFGTRGKQRIVGLPGNPVSAFVCTRLFVVPMLEAMLGMSAPPSSEVSVTLGTAVEKNGPRQHYMRASLARDDSGRMIATPARSQDSSLLSALAGADCLLIRPPHADALDAGSQVNALPLDF